MLPGRFGRRALTRGALGAGAALLAPGVDRPAASAFGFATGAAMELPAVTAPLLAFAAALAWRRGRSRRAEPARIAAGAAVGILGALLTRRVWPVAPHEPAVARVAARFDDAVAGTTGATLAVVVNCGAGSSSEEAAAAIKEAFPHATVDVVSGGDELRDALERAADTADVIGVSGGDGSVNLAARIAHERDKPLLVLAGGTLNHFAHALGVETIDDAVAAATGSVAEVDVACIADREFVNVASLGVYPELVAIRERYERRVGKWPAVGLALVRVLRGATPVHLEVDGISRRVWLVFVGNCRYRPHGFAPSWRERLDDGVLDMRIVDAASPWSRTRLVLAVMTGTLGRSRVYEERSVKGVEIRSLDGPLRLAADGEVFDGPSEFHVTKQARSLRVLVPGS